MDSQALVFLELLLCVRHSRAVYVCVCTCACPHMLLLNNYVDKLFAYGKLTFSQAELCIQTILHQFGGRGTD